MFGRALNLTDPVERSHPLNYGLFGEWAVAPGIAGGGILRNLLGRNHGTLTNGPTWGGAQGRPGGFGAINLDGSDDCIVCPTVPVIPDNGAFTLAAWLRNNSDSSSASAQSVFNVGASGGNSPRLFLRWESSVSGWIFDTATTTLVNILGSATSFTAGVWFHLAIASTGTSTQLYKDGIAVGAAGTGAVKDTSTSDLFNWGRFRSGDVRPWGGTMDQLMLWTGRTLSDADVWRLYTETRLGNRARWSWLDRKTWVGPSVAAATTTPSYLTLLGVGA